MSAEKSEIYFFEGNKSRLSESMQAAFQMLADNGFIVSWVDEKQVYKLIDGRELRYFVFETFDGKTYEHIRTQKCRIFGPNCILQCNPAARVHLPVRDRPVMSLCMRSIAVTITGFNKQRKEELIKKIELMCGVFSNELKTGVTHIVAYNAMSNKCRAARGQDFKIMTDKWIDDCWEQCKTKIFLANSNDYFRKYRLPLFAGMNICVSQLSPVDRSNVKKLVEANGGIYSGSLNLKVTTHLILMVPRGDKFESARKRRIFILTKKWLEDSVEKGRLLKEEDYLIDEEVFENCEEPIDSKENKTQIEERIRKEEIQETCPNLTGDANIAILQTQIFVESPVLQEISQLYHRKGSESNVNLFDGFDFYIIGCDKKLFQKLRNLIVKQSGFVSSSLKESITHVISGPNLTEEDVLQLKQQLKSRGNRVPCLHVRWIIDCSKTNELLSVKSYLDAIFYPENNAHSLSFDSVNEIKNSESRIINKKEVSICDQHVMNEYNEMFMETETLDTKKPPLDGCVITFSLFGESMKKELKEIASSLGATCQDYFSRAMSVSKKVLANTHLVVEQPEGIKYESALKWNIHCVSKEWIYKCRDTQTRANEEEFLIRKKIVTDKIPESSVKVEEINNSYVHKNFSENNELRKKVQGLMQLTAEGNHVDLNRIQKQDDFQTNLDIKEVDIPCSMPVVWKPPIERVSIPMVHRANTEKLNFDAETGRGFSLAQINEEHSIEKNETFQATGKTSAYRFMITGFQEDEKDRLVSIINELGGEVLNNVNFDPSCTHLIVKRFLKNEKIICCTVSGKWVLVVDYLIESQQKGYFLEEKYFDYSVKGNNIPDRYRAAMIRWREKIQRGESKGPYSEKKIMIIGSDTSSYARIIRAGGGIPLEFQIEKFTQEINQRENELIGINFAIAQITKKVFGSVSQITAPLKKFGIDCVKVDYLLKLITSENQPEMDDLLLSKSSSSNPSSGFASSLNSLSVLSNDNRFKRDLEYVNNNLKRSKLDNIDIS
ncbi:DNA topoisomerase 2-binding protein 1-like protein [Dinothrombium tinctorium]|uniref:DNA topoisomerase 2-binding protein 1-like protein n=1 Tax=Dinothrombium tinctorium TaxID=1965070 RepID=A0A443RQ52_9ACAR|nr:DNA topoisomerase 2-binding protein 1-like protein [Dinothrombium tinctorium]